MPQTGTEVCSTLALPGHGAPEMQDQLRALLHPSACSSSSTQEQAMLDTTEASTVNHNSFSNPRLTPGSGAAGSRSSRCSLIRVGEGPSSLSINARSHMPRVQSMPHISPIPGGGEGFLRNFQTPRSSLIMAPAAIQRSNSICQLLQLHGIVQGVMLGGHASPSSSAVTSGATSGAGASVSSGSNSGWPFPCAAGSFADGSGPLPRFSVSSAIGQASQSMAGDQYECKLPYPVCTCLPGEALLVPTPLHSC